MAKTPKLTVLFEKLRGQTFTLDKEVTSIGRKDDVDIVLKDGSVSGHHADIYRVEQDGEILYVLRDNDSTNKTRINSVEIQEQVLRNSDLITFGNVEVLFDGAPGADADSDNFMQITHTIDLSSVETNTATSQSLVNLNPMAEAEARKQAKIRQGLMLTYVLCAVSALVVVGWVAYLLFSKTAK